MESKESGMPRRFRRKDQASAEEIGAAAIRLQKAYWSFDAEEKRLLLERYPRATPEETLRLHHLTCLEMAGTSGLEDLEIEPDSTEAGEFSRETAGYLLSPESPYRSRTAMVFQGEELPSEEAEPNLVGDLYNSSLTHLGALEVIRVDQDSCPVELAFVPFDDLCCVIFPVAPSLLRAAQLVYEDLRSEMVLVPALYGVSWGSESPHDTDGTFTRFVCHVDVASPGKDGPTLSLGIGIGQQDLAITAGGSQSLFGLTSVVRIDFPLDMADPRFDERCRARGLDPEQIRKEHRGFQSPDS
jgi:hypothetical protein